MKKKSNLEAVKSMAKSFLYMDIQFSEIPVIIYHPVFETTVHPAMVNGDWKMLNLLNEEELSMARKAFISVLEKQSTIFNVTMLIRKPYQLCFLKYIRQYLSKEDRDKLLASVWVNVENPNQDANVSLRTAASWFRQANKKYLMDTDEFAYYEKLPQHLTVYRGVSVGRNPNGLSWTWSMETAKWFAHRFDIADEKGYIQMATVDKSEILAYFNGRDEDELVIDTSKIKERIEIVHE